jgi:toxin ParE1/3/4
LAGRELFAAAAFYDAKSPGLGEAFLTAVEGALSRLRSHPRAGGDTADARRRLVVRRFPYSIVYRVDEARPDEQLFIIAIAHHKRRPGYWGRRI